MWDKNNVSDKIEATAVTAAATGNPAPSAAVVAKVQEAIAKADTEAPKDMTGVLDSLSKGEG